jgi:hypothetical protein
LDKLISIDVELIANITGFPSRGMDLAQFIDDKAKEKVLVEEMVPTGKQEGSLSRESTMLQHSWARKS